MRPIVNALIDEFIDSGETDLIKNFTFEFPTRVIAKLLGLPEEDLPLFRKWAVDLISYTVKYTQAFESSAALKDYFLVQTERRRSHPTEDIIGDLVTAEIDGERLTDEAIYSFLRLLLPAGLETTYRSSGNLLYLLLAHPQQFKAVQEDHELIGPAIEEGLRSKPRGPPCNGSPRRTPNSKASRSRQNRWSTYAWGRRTATKPAGSAPRNSTSFASARSTSPSRQAPHVSRPASGPVGDPGRRRMPAHPVDQSPVARRR